MTHSPTHPLTHSPTHPLTHSPTHPLTHSPTHPLTHSLTHSPTHSPTHPRAHTHTHSLASNRVDRREVGGAARRVGAEYDADHDSGADGDEGRREVNDGEDAGA